MEKESGGGGRRRLGRGRERDPVVALVSPVDWERAREFGREGSAYGGSRFAVREGRQEGAHAVGGRVPFSIVTMPHIVDSWLIQIRQVISPSAA